MELKFDLELHTVIAHKFYDIQVFINGSRSLEGRSPEQKKGI
jgi:hypothetical protein